MTNVQGDADVGAHAGGLEEDRLSARESAMTVAATTSDHEAWVAACSREGRERKSEGITARLQAPEAAAARSAHRRNWSRDEDIGAIRAERPQQGGGTERRILTLRGIRDEEAENRELNSVGAFSKLTKAIDAGDARPPGSAPFVTLDCSLCALDWREDTNESSSVRSACTRLVERLTKRPSTMQRRTRSATGYTE